MQKQLFAVGAAALVMLLNGSCAPRLAQPEAPASTLNLQRSELAVQSLVMKMADDYNVALVEAMRPIVMDRACDPTARQLAQWFQRNGMGAALDIAVGPNPDAALLDMLVLVSLQCWAFDHQWVARGIPEGHAREALELLRRAEEAAWLSAASLLSEGQQQKLRGLIQEWIRANPDRFAVAFVRFGEFVEIRNDQRLSTREEVAGLLREVSRATATVDSARLLGERAVWFASRYPYVLGQQAELTLYRLADQPEFRSAMEAIGAVKDLGEGLSARVEALDRDVKKQQEFFFASLTAERSAAIEQARAAAGAAAREVVADVDARVAVAREAAVTQAFDRLAKERKELLDDIESREGALRQVMEELRSTIGDSTGLAKELTGTVDAIDRVVARFDRSENEDRKPLDMKDVRDAAIEATKAAQTLTGLLERTNEMAGSAVWDQRIKQFDHATNGMIDRAFWRALVLVIVLIGGLGLLRFLPARGRGAAPPGERTAR